MLLNELAHSVALAMGVESRVEHLPARNEVLHTYSSHEKVQRVFGGRELCGLDDGLRQMSTWVKQHGVRQSQKFEGIEVVKNLPPVWMDN
jgi:UDP-glucose 4-epimerase